MLRNDEILQDGHAREQADVLERAGDAGLARDLEVRHALEQKQVIVASVLLATLVAPARSGECCDRLRIDGAASR